MKAKIFKIQKPFELVLEEEELSTLQPNEYLAKTIYSAISPGTETAAYIGMEPLRPGNAYPRLVGYCNIARVEQIGESISHINIGDYILTFQSHRSAFIQNDKDFALVLPPGIHLNKAATIYLFHLGLHALQTADTKAGNTVGIIGMGTLGVTTALLSNIANAETYLLSSNITKNTLLKGITLLPKDIPSPEEIDKLTNNIGFDIIINTSNTWNDWKLALELTRKGGVIVNIGFPGRGQPLPNFNPLDPKYIYFKNIQIKSLQFINETNVTPIEFRFNLKRNLEYLTNNILTDKLNPDAIISDCIPYHKLETQYQKYQSRTELLFSTILDWKD